MKKFRVLALALAASALLAGCGGATPGDQTPKIKYSRMVSFGDSLSDVGTYKVGVVVDIFHSAAHYSVNGVKTDGMNYTNWTEFLSAQLGLTAPCSAETGLNTSSTPVLHADGFSYPVFGPGTGPVETTEHPACTNYAQGGGRVTLQPGPGNVALFNPADPSTYGNALGQLTKPVVDQITAHLTASGGTFASDELVTVMAGGNDVFINLAMFPSLIAYYMGLGNDQATATGMAATATVTAMATAGAEEAGYVNAMIVANGAAHVVVVNLPDVSKTPFGYSQTADTQGLIVSMVDAFNTQLKNGLAASASKVVLVDAAASNRDEAANPAVYGLTNTTVQACDDTKVGTSLFCTGATLIAGDVSRYEFADSVHPTPFGYKLLAQLVSEQLILKGWL